MKMPAISSAFPRYTEFDPLVPVWCVTPNFDRTIHRYYDSSPFSPSGRYLALTRLACEDRMPKPGEPAEIILVDLETGQQDVIAQTYGWDTQLGAHAQWGESDSQLLFNDLDIKTWQPFGVIMNPETGERHKLGGPIYHVSADGKWSVSPDLTKTSFTQLGYGVNLPPEYIQENVGAPANDGIFITNLLTGEHKLLASLAQVQEAIAPSLTADDVGVSLYGMHTKWNAQGNRIMFVVRHKYSDRRWKPTLVSMKPDGTDIRTVLPSSVWSRGGHHPNWLPDGDNILMNLKLDSDKLDFVRLRHDGGDPIPICKQFPGSGHPTMHPNEQLILTDTYLNDKIAFGDGTIPIRLIDLQKQQERTLIRIRITPPIEGEGNALRIDPHPAWDPTFTRIAFNGCTDGTRRVFVADLAEVIKSTAMST